MITIPQLVEKLIRSKPYLEEALADGLVNISSLARKLQPIISEVQGKEVSSGAIVMAINRMDASVNYKIRNRMNKMIGNLGDIIVRSDLSNYTFENSQSLIQCQMELLEEISGKKDVFHTFSQGVYETNLVLSNLVALSLNSIFKDENLLSNTRNLSSITIKLPQDNTELPGLYYYIFKKIAWEGINIVEVISTTNEFTIVVEDSNVERAFSVLKNLKQDYSSSLI